MKRLVIDDKVSGSLAVSLETEVPGRAIWFEGPQIEGPEAFKVESTAPSMGCNHHTALAVHLDESALRFLSDGVDKAGRVNDINTHALENIH